MAFRCRPAGRKTSTERFVASVRHSLNSPATETDLAILKKSLGDASPPLERFYAKHNGFVLYRDTLSDAAGVEALPIRAWAKATERVQDQLRETLDDEDDDSHGMLSRVAFGMSSRSGNFFIVETKGADAGSIFYTDHETASMEVFAKNFVEFIQRITSDPVTLLAKTRGCFARYADGETSRQWIPEAVVASGDTAVDA